MNHALSLRRMIFDERKGIGMKSILKQGLVSLCLAAPVATAAPTGLVCSNGTVQNVGDSIFVVNLGGDRIDVNFWESGFSLNAGNPGVVSAKTRLGQLYLFENATANFSGEGLTWSRTLNGSMFYDEGTQTLTTALRFDQQSLRLETIDCKASNL